MSDLKKVVEDHINAEIQRFTNNISFNTVNKVIDYLKNKQGFLVKIENVSVVTDDDGVIILNVVMRKQNE